MLALLQRLDSKGERQWAYVVASTDQLSAQKAERHERSVRPPQATNPVVFLYPLAFSSCLAAPAGHKLNDSTPCLHARSCPASTAYSSIKSVKISHSWRAALQTGSGAQVYRIPRSREVGQSYVTSVWTTIVALCAAFQIVLDASPDIVRTLSLSSSLSAVCSKRY